MNKRSIIALAFCGLITSCSQKEEIIETDNQNKTVEVIATIGEAVKARAVNGDKGKMSYNSFETEDQIGFYAEGGLRAENEILTSQKENSFSNSELQWTNAPATNVFAYYPYSSDATQIDIWRERQSGKLWKDGFEDVLATDVILSVQEGIAIGLNFKHQFAMLAITRGEGFSSAKEKTMKITLNKQVAKTAAISFNKGKYSITLNKDGDTPAYLETTSNDNIEYIILPVGTIDNVAIDLQSITLKNDAGREITIDYRIDNKNNGKTTGTVANKIYNIKVMMRNNQAVVDPAEIVQWDKEEISIPEPLGIKSIQDLNEWAAAYNGTDGKKDNTKLEGFGKKDTNGKWCFLLLEDLDFSTLKEGNKSFSGITEFSDTFDGQGHTITGFTIQEMKDGASFPTGFIRTLTKTGIIKRLKLNDVLIYGKSNVGAFAGTAQEKARIDSCGVLGNSIVYGTKNVGGIAGNGEQSTWKENRIEPGVFISKTTNE